MLFNSASPTIASVALLFGYSILGAAAFSNSGNENLAVYWGQNSYGATHTDTANWQKTLATYCQDDTIDVIPLAFLDVFFSTGNLPSLDLANTCNVNDDPVFSGTNLPNCQFLAADIETCQANGKAILLSMGGATGAATFTSDSQAVDFANTIWDLFLGGTSSTRPFGAAVLDGVDLDIEGGSSTGFAAFVTQIRTLASGASKPYYVTGAPQCPFPDAYLGSIINAVGFDMLFVQFYNNFCGLTNFANANDWNFGTWDNWAKTVSPNPNIKIYVGAPASSTAAGSGYVDSGTLATIIQQTRSTYSSFGGVMLWDASQAYANDRYDLAVKSALTSGGSAPSVGTTSTTKTSTTAPTTTTSKTTSSTTVTSTAPTSTSSAGAGQCAEVATWVSNVAYTEGQQVTYGGHLWTAKWWSEADVPGGSSGDWTDDGICSAAATVKVNVPAYHISVTYASGVPTPSSSGSAAPTSSAAATKASSAHAKATGAPAVKSSRFFREV